MNEFVDGVDIGFCRCGNNVGVGRETLVRNSIVLNLHVYFADIAAALGDVLDENFLKGHLAADNLLDGVDGCVNRTIATCCRFEFLA